MKPYTLKWWMKMKTVANIRESCAAEAFRESAGDDHIACNNVNRYAYLDYWITRRILKKYGEKQ
jgi:hypothetical protein